MFSGAYQVKPRRAGLRTGWVTHRDYRREGPYFILSFLLLHFCILCGVIFKCVLKSILSIISAAGFETTKKKQTKTEVQLVSIAAVFRLVTQPLSDEPKNGCEGD